MNREHVMRLKELVKREAELAVASAYSSDEVVSQRVTLEADWKELSEHIENTDRNI